MTFLEWEDSYNFGIKEIDIQHRGLFDIISKLYNTKRYEPEGKYFYAMLNQLAEYTERHFATEERYMQEAQYPKLSSHQEEHVKFISELFEFMKRFENKEPDIEHKILSFLKSWYISHILGLDRDYQQTLLEKGFK